MLVHTWLIPSFYGDIRLTPTSETTCRLVAEKLTAREREALARILPKARSKKWLDPDGEFAEGETALRAPISKVSQVLARALKVNRKVVSAARFSDGTFEEVTEATFDELPAEMPEKPRPIRAEASAAAASVAVPVRGCPAPDFVHAELKAAEVLSHFLTNDQLSDFQRYNRFVTHGADTGHRYMVTSRQQRDVLQSYQRTLYDLDEERPLCVHDWAVPAAEEMLSLHLLLQLPGWERYLRRDEHDFALLAAEAELLALA